MKLLSRVITCCVVVAAAAGCAPVGGYSSPQARYNSGLNDLRTTSLNTVNGYAVSLATFLKTNNEAAAIKQAQRAVADSLKDPMSAQFRNVRMVPYGPGSVICGEVNGKNSYGGYVGFKRFVASASQSEIVHESSKYPQINNAANAGLDAACGR